MNKELHTVEGSKLVGELLNERKRRNKDHKKRKHANIITFLFGSSDAVFTNTYARALVGALLTVAESKPAPGFMRSRLIPAIEIAIAASQLSVSTSMGTRDISRDPLPGVSLEWWTWAAHRQVHVNPCRC
jgi:hypothetical protein